ncbi:glyoxalase [Nocardia huaxiensis]|uniref:Glyoxalase n=1 Tax=Nocardia huaxiensis TaxID=2755382 RepID=A0A7D6VB16_9NOCA|nr:glyoxalase [Nocardia huaxiensis]QLY27915.1 glyoxalase [Nocardia huaxiensis]UFS98680.1 glyoxalase [Nocardia huaxiensis]
MAATSIPVLWGGDLPATLDFYRTLGYEVTYEQTRPYTAGMVTRDGFSVYFGPTPKDFDNAEQAYISALVIVDEVESWHQEFTASLRARYGRIPARGIPRITRFRPGQTRFTVVDPVGNSIIYIQRDEPDPEYGGARSLEGLARVMDNARIFRDSKNDDANAVRVLETGLRRFAATAPALDRARALAMLAEIAIAAEDSARVAELGTRMAELDLSAEDRAALAAELQALTALESWLTDES